jgi:hypothetical protein
LKEITSTAFKAICQGFLDWLAQPSSTPFDALVKQKRVIKESQIYPVKNNLRFIIHFIIQNAICPLQNLRLMVLTRLDVCQKIYELLLKRSVGSGRIHAIFLLIKKILGWTSSQQSMRTRQFIPPHTFPSFQFVDGICHEASVKRKQDARNRPLVLTQPNRARRGGGLFLNEESYLPKNNVNLVGHYDDKGENTKSVDRSNNHDSNSALRIQNMSTHTKSSVVLSREELSRVAEGTLEYLKQVRENRMMMKHKEPSEEEEEMPFTISGAIRYARYLATATFALALAPRSQVLRQMCLGSTFVEEEGNYWIKIPAEQSKNGKPILLMLPGVLSEPYRFYLKYIRPILLGKVGKEKPQSTNNNINEDQLENGIDEEFVFVQRNTGRPVKDFSGWTKSTCLELIGKAVNAHMFRHSIITMYYDSGANESELFQLATLMGHDPMTQRNYYVRPKWNDSIVRANQRVMGMLLEGKQPSIKSIPPIGNENEDFISGMNIIKTQYSNEEMANQQNNDASSLESKYIT